LKRFYKQAAAAPVSDGAAFAVHLDGKPVRTPGRAPLHLPTAGLADAVAAEWEAQVETIKPAFMPLTQLASTTLDWVQPQAKAIAAEIARYGETDLVCYRAETPARLIERQHAVWSPLLAWLEQIHGAKLISTAGIQPIPQPADALAAIQNAVAAVESFRLAALSNTTSVTGSVVIGLALNAGHITAEQAADAAHIDEQFQMEQWGADAEAEERLARLRWELGAVECFLALLD
jgi:chaperone required for assembly of F1-ATPase